MNGLSGDGARPASSAQIQDLADRALNEQREDEAIGMVSDAARRARTDPRLWQWSGLLHRALGQHAEALAAFDQAIRLAPADPTISHGRAQVMLEAGLAATAQFASAQRLAPANRQIVLGLAASLLADGRSADAIELLDARTGAAPEWIEGHDALARLRWMMGGRERFTESVERALEKMPRHAPLWQALLTLRIYAEQYERLLGDASRARQLLGEQQFMAAAEAVAFSETKQVSAADALFARLLPHEDMSIAVRRVRHLLRTGRLREALPLIDRWLGTRDATQMWPYASIAWRLAEDPRSDWLDRAAGSVSIFDLSEQLPPLTRLADVLRGLHRTRSQHLDQSVRGGTQTDGSLFTRLEPELQATRALIMQAVEAHVARLPAADSRHPSLAPPRNRRKRLAGSWSVRLTGGGHHASHVHSEGWISSALYISLPDGMDGGSREGWLTLGAPQEELGLGLPPLATIEPKPGRLVLFPSHMWHGTVPFGAGERLTIAFDIARPRA